jgi:PTH1 family peptidyl-tRNA hydrolase
VKILVGLGNPPREYGGTRHNVGFEVIDLLAERWGIRAWSARHHAACADGRIGEGKVLLAKPMTFMNLSGRAVRAVADYYGVEPSDILVIHDDVHLELGRLRLRREGSAGGHNGMQSVIDHLGTRDVPRMRIGIGCAAGSAFMRDHVLSRFSKSEREVVDPSIVEAADAAEEFIRNGIESTMNRFNKRIPQDAPSEAPEPEDGGC